MKTLPLAVALVLLAGWLLPLVAEEKPAWKPDAAAKYLDERATAWAKYRTAARGDGASRTTCVTCHTTFAYAIARPALRLVTGEAPTAQEQKILADVRARTLNWAKLDTAEWAMLYGFDEEKKRESWGTEAVLNSYLLALDDKATGQKEATAATSAAFTNLWATQLKEGKNRGSWDWLEFALEPWESPGSRYYGAAVAALATGTAPGYVAPAAPLANLRAYLRDGFAGQHLYNRVWALRASIALPEVLTDGQRQEVIAAVGKAQHADGGWALAELGNFTRKDGSDAAKSSDGYATGLVVHTLLLAGTKQTDPVVAKGVAWLKANQLPSGGWPGYSPNKQRDPESFAANFLPTSATAYAVLALSAVKP
jgi:hypothetical protein